MSASPACGTRLGGGSSREGAEDSTELCREGPRGRRSEVG